MKCLNRLFLILFLVEPLSTAYAEPKSESLPKHCPSQLFASELEAVLAASDHYNPLSIREDREYAGTIFKASGRYGYTVSAGNRRDDSWSLSIPTEDWDQVLAFWHTHGDASPANRYFSDADTRSVKKYGKPFYLADYTGYLKIFRRNNRTLSPYAADRLNLPRRSGFAIGEFVRDEYNRVIRVAVRNTSGRS